MNYIWNISKLIYGLGICITIAAITYSTNELAFVSVVLGIGMIALGSID